MQQQSASMDSVSNRLRTNFVYAYWNTPMSNFGEQSLILHHLLAGERISIIISGGVALIDPPVAQIAEMLTFPKTTFVPGGPYGCQAETQTHCLYTSDFRQRMAVPLGLLPRIIRHLEGLGGAVSVTDLRVFGPGHIADAAVVAAAGDYQPMLLAIARHTEGQLELAHRKDIRAALKAICQAYPAARIAIATATRKQAWWWWRKLTKRLKQRVGLAVGGTNVTAQYRITVYSYTYLNTLRGPRVDILLLVDPLTAFGEKAKEGLGHVGLDARRTFALTTPSMTLRSTERLLLETMTGPVIYQPMPEPVVTVEMLDAPSFPCTRGLDALAYKQTAYWGNDARNDRIAAAARAIAERNLARLGELGMTIAAGAELPAGDQPGKVIILTESVEQGRELLRRLPGWELLSGQDGTVQRRPCQGTAGGSIYTITYAADRPLDADVLIAASADGLAGLAKFPPRGGTRRQMLLIDIADDFDDSAKRNCRQRLRSYAGRGWTIYGAPNGNRNRSTTNHRWHNQPATTCAGISDPVMPALHTTGPTRPVTTAAAGSVTAIVATSKAIGPEPAHAGPADIDAASTDTAGLSIAGQARTDAPNTDTAGIAAIANPDLADTKPADINTAGRPESATAGPTIISAGTPGYEGGELAKTGTTYTGAATRASAAPARPGEPAKPISPPPGRPTPTYYHTWPGKEAHM